MLEGLPFVSENKYKWLPPDLSCFNYFIDFVKMKHDDDHHLKIFDPETALHDNYDDEVELY
jgi:hypothetical protein